MPQQALQPPVSGVTARMYRHGLGDCILLAFASSEQNKAYYVMIDCGVMWGTRNETKVMNEVVQNVIDATGGEVHLLAISHEHWDHIGGFTRAKETFAGLKIHNLWLSWTENPIDAQAARLRVRFETHFTHLAQALKKSPVSTLRDQLNGVLGFYGGVNLGAADFSPLTREAMQDLLELVPPEQRSYLDPGGRPLALPSVNGLAAPGVSAFVMAPSRDESYLGRLEGRETYEDVGISPLTSFVMSVCKQPAVSDEHYEMHELSMPFREQVRIPPSKAARQTFFRDHYGFGKEAASVWRRIDHDWLDTAGELAIQADRFTNNTSLVIAFRLDKTERVLLFPGDAQVGSWLSWSDVSWMEGNGGSAKVEAKHLLESCVFYKVGHHGSHNATIRQRRGKAWGLELMTGPDLVALVPTNEDMAHKKGWFRMPFEPLLRRLNERTRGRTVRTDTGLADKPNLLSEAEWTAFRSNFEQTPLYLQFTIPDE